MSYKVRLQTFEGPFDLLVYLIENAEMSIYDIKISEITSQYLAYIQTMQEMDVHVASEFMVLASALIEIKSKMILPRMVDPGDGNVVEEYETTVVRKVLSSKTAREMREIMEYVVAEGGGGNAKIGGYRVGGKTGTANKVDAGTGRYGDYYYSSFLGMAPMDDPKVSILVVVDSPKGNFYGSAVAAPIAKDILEDTLRYLNVEPKYTDEELKAIEGNYTVVPNVTGVELSEAIGMIGGKELKYSRPESAKGDDNFIIKDQYPKAGTKVKRGSVVYIYKE